MLCLPLQSLLVHPEQKEKVRETQASPVRLGADRAGPWCQSNTRGSQWGFRLSSPLAWERSPCWDGSSEPVEVASYATQAIPLRGD